MLQACLRTGRLSSDTFLLCMGYGLCSEKVVVINMLHDIIDITLQNITQLIYGVDFHVLVVS